jgi:orotidine-5'-phosphate decarboxylase
MSFREQWLRAVDTKNSVVCVGLDPAPFGMGRGEKGLAENSNLLEWSLHYIESVAPYVAAIKPNIQYWKGFGGMTHLRKIATFAEELGLVYIDDSKLADIGDTNDAGLYHSVARGRGAVTLSPFAGNMEQAVSQAQLRDVGLITMCLMSNPEYETVKNSLVQVQLGDEYQSEDLIRLDDGFYVKKYIQLAHDASLFGLDGIVVGAPSEKNHLKEAEIERVSSYAGGEMIVLLPGVGAQGGEADGIWQYFDDDHVIVNVGRSLMFPQGSSSSSEDHKTAARSYQRLLNEYRGKNLHV